MKLFVALLILATMGTAAGKAGIPVPSTTDTWFAEETDVTFTSEGSISMCYTNDDKEPLCTSSGTACNPGTLKAVNAATGVATSAITTADCGNLDTIKVSGCNSDGTQSDVKSIAYEIGTKPTTCVAWVEDAAKYHFTATCSEATVGGAKCTIVPDAANGYVGGQAQCVGYNDCPAITDNTGYIRVFSDSKENVKGTTKRCYCNKNEKVNPVYPPCESAGDPVGFWKIVYAAKACAGNFTTANILSAGGAATTTFTFACADGYYASAGATCDITATTPTWDAPTCVKVMYKVSGAVALKGMTIVTAQSTPFQTAFIAGLAMQFSAISVPTGSISINGLTAARRRRLEGVRIAYTVATVDLASATAVQGTTINGIMLASAIKGKYTGTASDLASMQCSPEAMAVEKEDSGMRPAIDTSFFMVIVAAFLFQ